MPELPTTCPVCFGSGFDGGELCTTCFGGGSVPIVGTAYYTLKKAYDIMDKCNDIMNKCNDIFEKINQ